MQRSRDHNFRFRLDLNFYRYWASRFYLQPLCMCSNYQLVLPIIHTAHNCKQERKKNEIHQQTIEQNLYSESVTNNEFNVIAPIFSLPQAEERILLRMKKVSSSVSLKKLFSALLMKKKLYSGRRRNLTQENCTVEMEATSFVGPHLMRLGVLQKIFLLSSS